MNPFTRDIHILFNITKSTEIVFIIQLLFDGQKIQIYLDGDPERVSKFTYPYRNPDNFAPCNRGKREEYLDLPVPSFDNTL